MVNKMPSIALDVITKSLLGTNSVSLVDFSRPRYSSQEQTMLSACGPPSGQWATSVAQGMELLLKEWYVYPCPPFFPSDHNAFTHLPDRSTYSLLTLLSRRFITLRNTENFSDFVVVAIHVRFVRRRNSTEPDDKWASDCGHHKRRSSIQ